MMLTSLTNMHHPVSDKGVKMMTTPPGCGGFPCRFHVTIAVNGRWLSCLFLIFGSNLPISLECPQPLSRAASNHVNFMRSLQWVGAGRLVYFLLFGVCTHAQAVMHTRTRVHQLIAPAGATSLGCSNFLSTSASTFSSLPADGDLMH